MSVCLSVCPSQVGVLSKRLNGSSKKARILPSGILSQTLNLADFSALSPRHVERRRCYQLRSTDDRRQFIALSVHHCLQHDGRDAARMMMMMMMMMRSMSRHATNRILGRDFLDYSDFSTFSTHSTTFRWGLIPRECLKIFKIYYVY